MERRYVALKVVEGRDASRNFLNELRMLQVLQGHPNIASFVSARAPAAESLGFIATTYHAGGSLESRLKGPTRMKELEASRVILDTLRALSFIHSREIIHRDVKPANIMRNSDGRYVLIDFDIACHEFDETAKSRRGGTPGFMAPELIRRRYYVRSADMFSVGALLYCVFRLQHPFPTKLMTAHSVMAKNARGTYRFGVHFDLVSDLCKDLIASLLRRDPNERPSGPLALQHAWFATVAAPSEVQENVSEDSSSAESGQVNLPQEEASEDEQVRNNLPQTDDSEVEESAAADALVEYPPLAPVPPKTPPWYRVPPRFLFLTRRARRAQSGAETPPTEGSASTPAAVLQAKVDLSSTA
eukprot:TRINITY_DN8936_c0_g3_i1.p1 TRINITY_DN8936_c0_g3~~TRINITY_DN8936_c0_g3_i1.p1  ORF type:complete len:412 (-),score=61.54 TRINITY_DN8936_c0_g3_i1:245-1315(-)